MSFKVLQLLLRSTTGKDKCLLHCILLLSFWLLFMDLQSSPIVEAVVTLNLNCDLNLANRVGPPACRRQGVEVCGSLTHWLSVRSPRKKTHGYYARLTVTDILPESLPEDNLAEYPTSLYCARISSKQVARIPSSNRYYAIISLWRFLLS